MTLKINKIKMLIKTGSWNEPNICYISRGKLKSNIQYLF